MLSECMYLCLTWDFNAVYNSLDTSSETNDSISGFKKNIPTTTLVFWCLKIAWYPCIWKTSYAITSYLSFFVSEGFLLPWELIKEKTNKWSVMKKQRARHILTCSIYSLSITETDLDIHKFHLIWRHTFGVGLGLTA